MNQTMKTFGYPESCVREYDHWAVLLRPKQVTLGALILVCKDEARAFGDITPAAFGELARRDQARDTAPDDPRARHGQSECTRSTMRVSTVGSVSAGTP